HDVARVGEVLAGGVGVLGEPGAEGLASRVVVTWQLEVHQEATIPRWTKKLQHVLVWLYRGRTDGCRRRESRAHRAAGRSAGPRPEGGHRPRDVGRVRRRSDARRS